MLLAGRAVVFSVVRRDDPDVGPHARQRHRILYDAPGTVSPSQIREAVQAAEQFLSQIEELIAPK